MDKNNYQSLDLKGGKISFHDNLLDIFAMIECDNFRIILKNYGDNFEIIGVRKSDLVNFCTIQADNNNLFFCIQDLIDTAEQKMSTVPERKFEPQFALFDKKTHEARMKRIKLLSKKQYLDDGPVALYHALLLLKEKGFDSTLEFALVELEKLYKLNETAPIE